MTERESKEFYDELRRKLEDYGNAPSESVWAGIRQQVPVKRRRWWRGGLVALILIGLVTYLAISTRHQGATPAATLRLEGAPGTASSSTGRVTDSAYATVSATEPASSLRSGTTLMPSTTSVPSSADTVPHTASKNFSSTSEALTVKQSKADSVLTALKLPHLLTQVAARSTNRQQVQPANAATNHTVTTSLRSRKTRDQQRRQAGELLATSFAGRSTIGMQLARLQGSTSAEKLEGQSANVTQESRATETQAARNISLATRPTGSDSGTEIPVPYKPIHLQRLPFGEPVVQQVAVDSTAEVPRFQRWSVEVLAGPAVSYRRLGTTDDSTTGNQLRRLERATLTYAAQAQLRYAFTPRLAVSVGVGYTQYATQLNYVLRRRVAYDSLLTTEAIKRYDTYRYLAVPVQVRYMLGQQGRFQYSALGGGSVGLYLGGRTSTGTACACEQQRWTGADSPFRTISLAIKAGLEVHYQVAQGWSILAQPHFQYGIQNILKPLNGPARYPFAAGLLTGFSYNLR